MSAFFFSLKINPILIENIRKYFFTPKINRILIENDRKYFFTQIIKSILIEKICQKKLGCVISEIRNSWQYGCAFLWLPEAREQLVGRGGRIKGRPIRSRPHLVANSSCHYEVLRKYFLSKENFNMLSNIVGPVFSLCLRPCCPHHPCQLWCPSWTPHSCLRRRSPDPQGPPLPCP